jgi:hypothetical protein
MIRNVLGSAFALLGAAATVWSPFRAWYDGREGQDIRIADLFGGVTARNAALWESVFVTMLVAAVVAVLGVVLRSRLVIALGGLVATGFTTLWMIRQGQALGSLTAGGDTGLGSGAALAFGGGMLMLLGACTLRRRAPKRRARHAATPAEEEPYTTGEPSPGGSHPYGSDPYGSRPQPYSGRGGPYGEGRGWPDEDAEQSGPATGPMDRPRGGSPGAAPSDEPGRRRPRP